MFYRKQINEIFKELNTTECGLTKLEAKSRLQQYGQNIIKEKKDAFLFKVIFHQFTDPLIYILLLAALITLLIGHYTDMGVILTIVGVNALFGFLQEYKAEKAMLSIKELAAPKATVIRESKEIKIDSKDIVIGDIVLLTAGNKVPADVRIFEVKDLEINESTFTGESLPSLKHSNPINLYNISIADQQNMAFMGTVVSHGAGKAIVVATGLNTELGKISSQVKETKKEKTPLQKRLDDFSKKIALLSISLAFLVFALGVILGDPIMEMVVFTLSVTVGIIPEGLLIVVTITMTIGIKRMADRNAIVRKLIAVETLGSCDYICTDKTGTLTENRMTVVKAYTNLKEFEFKCCGYKPDGGVLQNNLTLTIDEDLYKLLLCGVICNNSILFQENGEWKIDGDPTEGALLVSGAKFGIDIEEITFQYKEIDEIPFSSKKNYMATLNKKDNQGYIFAKGSPEQILEFSNNKNNEELLKVYTSMTDSGFRVLAFGMKIFSSFPQNFNFQNEATTNLEFLGFQAIMDPPREEVKEAILLTKQAGITTVMVTGDHKKTAIAIAKQIGIFEEGDLAVTGEEFETMEEKDLKQNIEKIKVFARVTPAQKYKIVETLKNLGHIVAVTGDGVNDAPALKKASIGIAMGKTGTDTAKEASDIILKDDNYETIFEAVKIGRIIFDNIQKVIFFLISTGLAFALIVITALLLKWPLPMLAIQVLWVNLVTNALQDVALAYEPGEENITRKPPINPNEKLINSMMLRRLIIVGIVMTVGSLYLFHYKLSNGADINYARSTALNTIVFFQFFNVLNSRSFEKSIFKINPFSNSFLFISIILSLSAQIAILHYKPLQFIFHTEALDSITWLQTVMMGLTVIIAIELDKFLVLKLSIKKEL
ncbi:MAG: HAD-IC family P-type ATPase [bacterium]